MHKMSRMHKTAVHLDQVVKQDRRGDLTSPEGVVKGCGDCQKERSRDSLQLSVVDTDDPFKFFEYTATALLRGEGKCLGHD